MRIIIYYKDMPKYLEDHVAHDKFLSLTKDGAAQFGGISCARAIVGIRQFNDYTDKERLTALLKVLDTLQKNNQIFAFTRSK